MNGVLCTMAEKEVIVSYAGTANLWLMPFK